MNEKFDPNFDAIKRFVYMTRPGQGQAAEKQGLIGVGYSYMIGPHGVTVVAPEVVKERDSADEVIERFTGQYLSETFPWSVFDKLISHNVLDALRQNARWKVTSTTGEIAV